jgi:hypothetical protein
MTTRDPIPAPPGLSARAATLWRAEAGGHTRSAGRLLLLEELCRAIDRADGYAATVGREGLTKTTERTGAVHIHPLLKAEQIERQLIARLAASLHLQWNATEDGRR